MSDRGVRSKMKTSDALLLAKTNCRRTDNDAVSRAVNSIYLAVMIEITMTM
jgi:hypothetical protein